MKASRILPLAAILAAPFALNAQVVIDDFSDLNVSEYTLTRVLDNGFAEANVSFSASSGSLVASYAGTVNQAEQVLFLRSDYTLFVGETLTVDVSFATQASQMDFGIAVSATTPTAASSGDTDTRDAFAWAAVYVRPSQNSVRSTFADTTAPVTATGVLTADETTVSKLFIRRNTANEFVLGYVNNSAVEVISQTVTFISSPLVGAQIGFYGDLRAVGGTLGSLDNLSLSNVPEPASVAALAGALVFGLTVARRRRRSA